MSKVHNFANSLDLSNSQSDDPMWEKVYRSAFPTLETMICVRKDGWAQRGGIDRVLTLSSGKTLTVDEKVRAKDYDDILLEYWSNKEKRIPGWIAKDLACDFIAYAFIPSKRCYLLPFHQLRLAWKNNKDEWVEKHFSSHARNDRYTTVSVAVPIGILMSAIKDTMTIYY